MITYPNLKEFLQFFRLQPTWDELKTKYPSVIKGDRKATYENGVNDGKVLFARETWRVLGFEENEEDET
jgi:hypothetical protein